VAYIPLVLNDRSLPTVEDAVLRATLQLAAVAIGAQFLAPEPADARVVMGRFQSAVRSRVYRESRSGLPADVVAGLVVVAVRMALDGPVYAPIAHHVAQLAAGEAEAAVQHLRARRGG
jgi:hypothetical protein